MNCLLNSACPILYTCQNGLCQHEPITKLSMQLVASILLTPCLLVLSNRIGISTVWVVYPVLITIMSYKFAQSLGLVAPLTLAASFVSIYLALRARSQSNEKVGQAVNFYIVNISIPVLVLGINIGLALSKITPFLYISIIALIFLSISLYLTSCFLKDIQANEKISKGLFRSMLPQRIRKPVRSNLSLQMALIQQADSQIQQHQAQGELSPSKKSMIRIQLLQSISSGMFPLRQLVVCVLCYLGYECLCLSIPELVRWLGLRDIAVKLVIGYLIVGVLVIIGQIYLYKFYVQPSKIQQQITKLNLGAEMNKLQITKICTLGLIGGILQGMIGFGFSYCLFFYLLHSLHKLKTTIATIGFLNLFISTTFTLSSIFCSQFYWLSYLIIFFVTLIVVSGMQYLFNAYIYKSVHSGIIQSTLMTLLIVIIVLALMSVAVGLGLTWVRFGWDAVGKKGEIQNC